MSKLQEFLANSFMKNILSLGGATLLSAAFSFVLGVVTRNILGPEEYGFWLSVSLIFTFFPLVQLGVVNAMNREVPFYKARGNYKKVQEAKSTTLSFLFTIPLLVSCILFIASLLLYFTEIEKQYKVGFVYSSLIGFILLMSMYVEMFFKSEQDFNVASKLIAIKSIIQSLLTVFFVYLLGYEGLFIGMGLSLIIQIYLGKSSFENRKIEFDIKKFKNFINIGFPILFVGVVWSILIATDRIIISIFMTPKDLGNYGAGMLIFNSMMLVPQVIGQVLYPKIVELISHHNYKQLYKLYWKVNQVLAIVMLLIVGSIYILIPFFVEIFLPNYKDAIKTGQILILGIYPLTLIGFAANYFNATHNQKLYLAVQVLIIIINISLSLLFLFQHFNLTSVALATAISYFLYAILMNVFFVVNIKKEIKGL
jgi:O-antigen/teichoic acid export membrane protein